MYSIIKGKEEPDLAFLPVRRLRPRRCDDDDDAVKKKRKISLGLTPGPLAWSFNVIRSRWCGPRPDVLSVAGVCQTFVSDCSLVAARQA